MNDPGKPAVPGLLWNEETRNLPDRRQLRCDGCMTWIMVKDEDWPKVSSGSTDAHCPTCYGKQ